MTESPDHTPSSEMIKLIVDKALLESEARTASTLSTTLSEQNHTYMTQIVEITKNVAKLEGTVESHAEKIRGFKGLVATVSSVTAALAGLISFFIAQLVNTGGGK